MIDKEFLEMKFDKADEVQPSETEPGEWYIWESYGFGYRESIVFQAADKPRFDEQPAVIHPRWVNGSCLSHAFLPISYCHARALHAEATHAYRSKLFRAVQQPQIKSEYWLENISELAGRIRSPMTGTDPEIFVEDAVGNVIPAWEFLPPKAGQRDLNGHFPPGSGEMFWDGFQAEFTVPAGCCQDGVAFHIAERLLSLEAKVKAQFPDAKLSKRSVVEIPPGLMRSAKSEHVAFGCRPSLNAYGLAGEVVADLRELPIRFAGGHIHWGNFGQSFSEAQWAEAVKFVDLVAGLISVSISEGLDDPRRRRYYGLAGEFRLPAHGIEYRTLSNSWLLYPAVYHLLFTTGRLALRLGLAGGRKKLSKVPEFAVVNAINNTDHKLARSLIQEDEQLFKAIFRTYLPTKYLDTTFAKVLTPMTSWGLNLDRITDNWQTPGQSNYRQRWYDFMLEGPLNLDKATRAKNTAKPTTLPNVSGDTEHIRPFEPRA